VVAVETAAEMREAVLARFDTATVVIGAAAVADYAAREPAAQKIKRKGAMALELTPTADILAELGARRKAQLLVGFAAETEHALENARKKLASKSLDAIVVNDVSRKGIGFDSDRNAVTILTPKDKIDVPESSKWEVAHRVLDAVVRLKKKASPRAPAAARR
jgi:phosphopantothenoylcysteine decarboxylase/phosphopantothenate--cysteine ligase